MPIGELDGVKISCCIRIITVDEKSGLVFSISTKFDLIEEDEYEPIQLFSHKVELSSKDIEHVCSKMDELFKIVNGLKFDKLYSSFIPAEHEIIDYSFLTEYTNLKLAGECCVCKEITHQKTVCDHTLCVPCMSNIKPVKDEYGIGIPCPICRKAFAYP